MKHERSAAEHPNLPAATLYAHSLPDHPVEDWEPLAQHLQAVAGRAAERAEPFGCAELARCAGLLHDIGKCSPAFQRYIRAAGANGAQGPDHSTAGAREAARAYAGPVGRMLAGVAAPVVR